MIPPISLYERHPDDDPPDGLRPSGQPKISGPEWLNIDMFDTAATLPQGATKDQMRSMLQNLLAERFHMESHREKQNLPAYVLIAAKGRVRLPAPKDAASKPSHKENTRPGTRSIACTNCAVSQAD